MFCEKCGNPLQENAKFCDKCGEVLSIPEGDETVVLTDTVLTDNNDETEILTQNSSVTTQQIVPAQLKKKKKRNVGLIFAAVVVVLIVIVGCVGIFMWMNRPINKIENALMAGDLDEASQVYAQIEDEDDLDAVREQALKYAERVKSDYMNEVDGVDYATANDILNELYSDILVGNEALAEMIEVVDRINISRASFESAEKFKDAGRYADAITEYNNVIEEDTSYYELAQASLVEIIEMFRADALDTAKAYQNDGDYEEAKEVLDDALKILVNDSSLLSELNLVQAYIQDALVEESLDAINVAVEEGRYSDAFMVMSDIIKVFPDDSQINSAKITLESTYKTTKMTELTDLYNIGAIDEALLLLEEMQKFLPDDSEIVTLIGEYKTYVPTALSTLTVYEYNKNLYAKYEPGITLTDTYENVYYDAISLYTYDDDTSWGELVFLNNGKFNRISGLLAYEYCDNTKGNAHVEIYADDVLVYTSKSINDSTEPFTFEAILEENCHKLKFKWISDSDRYESNIILANAQVYNR